MSVHWQPRDDNPVEEFAPEPSPTTPPVAAPSRPAFTARTEIARPAMILDALLLVAAGAAFGAVGFALYWTLR